MENNMRMNVGKRTMSAKLPVSALIISMAALSILSARADRDGDGRYRQTNLVSDEAGKAVLQDTHLVNAWGISFSPTSPFWISDNGTGLSTLYIVTNDASGMVHVVKRSLEVSIPGEGSVTGQLSTTRPLSTRICSSLPVKMASYRAGAPRWERRPKPSWRAPPQSTKASH
jgi:hypothetical protein